MSSAVSKIVLSTLMAAIPSYTGAEQKPVLPKSDYRRTPSHVKPVKSQASGLPNCNVPLALIQSRMLHSKKA